MVVIRSAQGRADDTPKTGRVANSLEQQAAELFAVQVAANRIPSVRAIRAQLHAGQPRAQRLRVYLAAASGMHDEHASAADVPGVHDADLVRIRGESGRTARLIPLTVNGLIYASPMVMLNSARRKAPVPTLARWLLDLGIAATLRRGVEVDHAK